ncbi:MAG: undecaprenyl-diphosphate phosphatase [Eubacteriaceae bacterium]|jgi:undecaprenyl-diphosphatase|nr:undecaprenyl-diphosphate phosphatase [Eubacteriaceae bacterium]
MNVSQAIILGAIQGITEFLPVSSSGHLAVAQHFFGISEGSLAFSVVLHIGTLASIFIAYRESCMGVLGELFKMLADIATGKGPRMHASKYRYYIVYILAASVPAAVVGLLFDSAIERMFGSIYFVSVAFMASALILLIGERASQYAKGSIRGLGFGKAIGVGLFQMAAIMPGITRSGTTLTGGIVFGLQKEDALEFSFLLAVPAVLGSTLLEAKDILKLSEAVTWMPLAIGFIVSMAFGLASIMLLKKLVQKGSTVVFSVYLAVISLALTVANIIGSRQ